MTNSADFWASVSRIIDEGFTADGLQQLDRYAELFISERLVYKRFSPLEQYGCTAGGTTHVIATLLAGAEVDADTLAQGVSDFKRMCQRGETQALRIEQWAKAVGVWIDNIDDSLTHVLGEHIAEGGEAMVYDHGATNLKPVLLCFGAYLVQELGCKVCTIGPFDGYRSQCILDEFCFIQQFAKHFTCQMRS